MDQVHRVATVIRVPDQVQEVVVAGGVTLVVHCWEGGAERPPVLLVHGLASNLRLWDGVAGVLASRGHRVAALDLRGHGASDKPDQGYDLTTLTDDLVAVLGTLGFDRAVVVGQSMGANLALELAWRAPTSVAAIACIDGGWIELQRRFPHWERCAVTLAPPATAGRPLAEIKAMLRSRHRDWPEAGIEGALACFERRAEGTVAPWLTRERHLALLRALWEHRPSRRYPEVDVPVLLVPAGDPATAGERREEVEAAAAALPRCEVHWMAGDHDLHAQHPEAVAALVSSFSASIPSSTSAPTPSSTSAPTPISVDSAVPGTAEPTENGGGDR